MNLFETKKAILFLGAHPDDEISCSATLHRLIQQGHDVHYAFMSDCAISTKALGFPPEQLVDECLESCHVLGIKPENIYRYDFPVRKLPQYRQEILEELVALRKRIDPGLVFVASRNDHHQDHHAVSLEAIRAFKYSSIIGYEFPWNQLESRLDLLVKVSEENVAAKMESWACYKTQNTRGYHGDNVFLSLLQIRGMQANTRYAESYEVIRLVT